MRVLVVVTLGLVGLGCGGPGASQSPPAPPPASAPAPRFIESRPMPPDGVPPPGWMAGSEIDAPASAPVVKGGVVMGPPLSKEQIREAMQANQPKVRYCYERELLKSPSLAGTVVVKFVIRADGSVASAVVASSTLGNAAVEQCIANAVTKLVFPPPLGGGIVVVTYPYTLQTADGAGQPAGQ